MANRWGNNGNSDRLYLGGLQNNCRWWLQPWNSKTLSPWKKSYDQPRQHIKKQRHYFAKVHLVKTMVFLLVMYGCESWTIKKPEHWKTVAFELWCWRPLLRVPWTERMSNQSDLILGGSKITADGDCSHEIQRHLLLGRKVMTNLDSIFKSRDITLPTKVLIGKMTVFPVVMYGCESWTIKKPEHQRIDAFELWCWRRLLRVPWISRR